MGFWSRLFGPRPNEQQPSVDKGNDHAVLIYLKLSDDAFGQHDERESCYELEDECEAAIQDRNTGELDGHDFGEGYCTIYCYGPCADTLYDSMADVVNRFPSRPGSYVIKRYGDINSNPRETRIDL